MLSYFPDNYAWNLTMLVAVDAVGTISEIDDAVRHLKQFATADAAVGGVEWWKAWSALAARLADVADDDLAHGRTLSAGRKLMRSALYDLFALRFLDHTDPRELETYRRGTARFETAARLRRDRAEFVSIPYDNGYLPAILIHAPGDGPKPCLIHFGGYDSLKEWVYPMMREPFGQRGVSLLLVDQAGVGGALRLYGLPAVVETERSAAACLDYLARRPEIDSSRVGIEGISLGGYYAPRAAAFEPRLAACICWGGIWDLNENFEALVNDRSKPRSIPDMFAYGRWVFGVPTDEDFWRVSRGMTLAPIIDRIRCPILVLHGENDTQVVPRVSERTYEHAVNSRRRELKVFDQRIGGVEHCNADNMHLAVDYMADWSAEVLGGYPSGA
jgi:dienelactone hydrolase